MYLQHAFNVTKRTAKVSSLQHRYRSPKSGVFQTAVCDPASCCSNEIRVLYADVFLVFHHLLVDLVVPRTGGFRGLDLAIRPLLDIFNSLKVTVAAERPLARL